MDNFVRQNIYIDIKDNMNKYILFATCVAISFLPGVIGTAFMDNQQVSKWYLEGKPSFTPPGWVFPVVWNILYFMLGVSLYSILMQPRYDTHVIWLVAANLLLNALWTPLFFKHKMFLKAYTVIIGMIVVTSSIVLNTSVNTTAKALLIPYIAWLSYASVLNLHFVLHRKK
jgi:benzodiazapine receptor